MEPGARVTAALSGEEAQALHAARATSRAHGDLGAPLRGFEGKRLPVGAKLTVQVTKYGTIGAVKTLTIRRRKAPSVTTRCLPPGATAPSAC